jgi:hypothetical protein
VATFMLPSPPTQQHFVRVSDLSIPTKIHSPSPHFLSTGNASPFRIVTCGS